MQKTILIQLLLLSFATLCYSLPLSTSSRWIVDGLTGARVKLICANWPGHPEPMLAEGLNKRPVGEIVRHTALMGFNCVRLTYATHMFTRYAHLTVTQNFRRLGLQDEIEGISHNNPEFLNMTVVEAQTAVIEALGQYGVMVVLDNQVSHPMWCCSDDDGNGFFGDKYFDPQEWLKGLHIVANRYKDTSMVVAMSLRNELRGPLQNETVWRWYMSKGAETIHKANPNSLVLVSGLTYDIDFTFLKKKPLKLNIKNKIVYEFHRYSFSEGQGPIWLNQSLTKACDSVMQETQNKVGFLGEGENAAPLFITEFGINQMGTDRADNLFLACYVSFLAEKDLDWTIWALQGSYYLRDGLHNPDPSSMGPTYFIMYHPWSGNCMHVDKHSKVHPSDCWSYSKWSHAGNGNPIRLIGTELCLSAAGDGIPVTLSNNCTGSRSKWQSVSNSKFRLANKDEDGTYLCLDWDPDYSSRILTNKCKCLEHDCHPHSQWFKLISANVE
ncbi:hypothetical protein BUALT_Bualt10G0058600 [Buddleja alternifolia]|uniref:Glycoside hydrolase family 5 domain-containing protein n=1 Tax=Buddleja alternifolia TaxID=168488 RepID=A0AAV6WXH8_9LAMI|nr:hypothetical protein BUALT_Bualt10G0058600 [Buddleja alternifolia]